ncbi:fibroblast growth factor 24 [Cololabis saira]|uniref:fibroblast growth factor 24 n=1 Tax=Cololabis saira TaxID=129043 RepID=UPI002AD2BC5A|nr:fibroblast growth factor 24 [Cololabis saira]
MSVSEMKVQRSFELLSTRPPSDASSFSVNGMFSLWMEPDGTCGEQTQPTGAEGSRYPTLQDPSGSDQTKTAHTFFMKAGGALLVVETETFGSHIRIKGKESEHYICMNEKGKIVGRPDGRKQECVFVEEFLENNYTALVSAKYKGWYLGFNRKGRPKKGSRTNQKQQEVHFMKRQPKGRVDPVEEFRFTTVTKRTRRARRLKPNSRKS